mgnify:FL=1
MDTYDHEDLRESDVTMLHNDLHGLLRKAGVFYSYPDACRFGLKALRQWLRSVIEQAIDLHSSSSNRSESATNSIGLDAILEALELGDLQSTRFRRRPISLYGYEGVPVHCDEEDQDYVCEDEEDDEEEEEGDEEEDIEEEEEKKRKKKRKRR